jgi:hypothetical protein
MKIARKLFVGSLVAVGASACAQVPDLLSSFDAGGRAFGSGGAFYVTASETLSATNNPAGLGFVNERVAGLAARSFPKSITTVTGPLNNLRLDSTETNGDVRLSHIGFAKPISGGKGAIGIAWTTGGWMNDDRVGQNLPGGIATYLDAVRIRTDFLNISWGKANTDQTMSFGIGLVVGVNSVFNRQLITFTDPQADPISARSDKQSYGLGAQVGVMMIPKNRPNLTFGASIRTPIEMVSSDEALSLYDKIPGRIAAGLALRQEGYRGGRDYVIYGAEVEHFFSSSSNDRITRDDHTGGHVGFEYNYVKESFSIPIRFGFSANPGGGDGFDSRTSLNYGIGYRPVGKNWSIDIAFGNSSGGAKDTAISFSYKF